MTPHRGMLVLLPPRKGWGGPSYAKVTKVATPDTVQITITADSGGRRKGLTCHVPWQRLTARSRGVHRRPRGRPAGRPV